MSTSSLSIPISVGELFDKITILRIKTERIHDVEKLTNVKRELNLLTEICTRGKLDLTHHLVDELYAVNLKLWKIEDDLRDKERVKEFDRDFIELARAVYVTNDERFRVKKEINKAFHSQLSEEKSYQDYLS